MLDWEGALNARDTGGLPTSDGGHVRRGALVRSDVLSRLTASGRKALLDHGVRTIIDVRQDDELAVDGDQYPRWEDTVTYLNVPFNIGRSDAAWRELKARYEAATSRAELNRLDLEGHKSGIAEIVSAIADAETGGVLVHCHAGKDRTGAIVALLLSVAGVSDDDIADDYALTMLNIEPLIVEWLDSMTDDPAQRERLRLLAEPRREAMLETLAYLREHYGGAEQYLLAAGVSEQHLARIRERLIEHADG